MSLFKINFLNIFANNFTANLFLIFVSTYLLLEKQSGKLLFLYFFVTFISIPFWYYLGKYFKSMALLKLALIIAIVGFSLVIFLEPGDLILYTFIVVVTGSAVGVDIIAPTTQLTFILDDNKKVERQAQFFTAFFSMGRKLGIGLGAGIALIGYGWLKENQIQVFPNIDNLLIFYFILPMIFKTITLYLTVSYQKKYE